MGEYSGGNLPDELRHQRPREGRFPPELSHVRLSDAERDAIASELGQALSEGRLTPDEHAERLDVLFAAKTQGELEPLIADLPGPYPGFRPLAGAYGPPHGPHPAHGPHTSHAPASAHRPLHGAERIVGGRPTSLQASTSLSSSERTGSWVVPGRFPASSFLGSITLDLREARFLVRETTINADTYCGSIEVIVPDDVIVRVDGTGIMGSYWLYGDQPRIDDPYAPVVNITGYAFMGSVCAFYKPRAHQQPRRWWQRKPKAPQDGTAGLFTAKSPGQLEH